jgi:2,4-dienoyl-CoA reductase-like NADH-dependent reductase (Old Yellow Enzyme family)
MPSWRIEDTIKLAEILSTRGVDFLDVSAGGNHPKHWYPRSPAYQVEHAAAVKAKLGDSLLVGAVGAIHDSKLAESVLQNGSADVILVGRLFQKRPGLVWDWAEELGVRIKVANQIEWAFSERRRQ